MDNEGKTREGKVLDRRIDCSVAVFGSSASSYRAHLMTRARGISVKGWSLLSRCDDDDDVLRSSWRGNSNREL